MQADEIVIVRGRVDRRGGGDECNIIVNEIIPINEVTDRYTTGMIVRLDENLHGMEMISKLREVTRAYPGRAVLKCMLQLNDGTQVTLKSMKQRIEINQELRGRLDDLLGVGNIKMITQPPKPQNGQNSYNNGTRAYAG